MKSRKPKTKPLACILINQLGCPGLGTILHGRMIGYAQLILILVGALLFCWYMAIFFNAFFQYATGDIATESEFRARYQKQLWRLHYGLLTCAVAWLWSLVSSIQIWREDRANPTPPPLPPQD